MKPNRKHRITAHTPKQVHRQAQGQILSCTCSMDGITIHRRSEESTEVERSRKRNGFTLIEMIVVISIIGIISAMAVPSMIKRLEYKRYQATLHNTEVLNLAVHDYMIQQGAQETTFGNMPVSNPSKWEEVSELIRGGFESCEVVGYSFNPSGLNDCYRSIVAFKGVTATELYTKYQTE